MFEKGHPPYKGGGKKGRSGRKKSPSTIIKEAIDKDAGHVPEYLEAMRNKALIGIPVVCPECKHKFEILGGGDREAIQSQLDRHLGKATARSEIEIAASGELSRAQKLAYLKQIIEIKRQFEAGEISLTDEHAEAGVWPTEFKTTNNVPLITEQSEVPPEKPHTETS